jgi:N-carbamoyl-L-amino-acid hydrolase
MSMASGAGHDMAFISRVAPAAMLFIPCRDGRSHTPEEWASPEAVAAGARVLLQAIIEVDAEP